MPSSRLKIYKSSSSHRKMAVGKNKSMAEYYCPDSEWGSDKSNNKGKTSYPNFIAGWIHSPVTRNDANWQFYKRKLRSQPDGATIDEMHSWYHDMDKLERKHGYIQWLFPVSGSSGQNEESQPLQPAEAEAIRTDSEAQKLLLRSYEMMLNFYGMQIHNHDTGELRRAPHWKKRFANLNSSTHNHMRITRIIKSIGELGLERYQFCLVKFLLREALIFGELRDTLNSCKKYWIPAVKEETERNTLIQRCYDYEFHSRRKAELERIADMEAKCVTPTTAETPDKKFENKGSQKPLINQDVSIDQLLSFDQTADSQAHALPPSLVPCQALPTAAPGTREPDPSRPRAAAAESLNRLIPATQTPSHGFFRQPKSSENNDIYSEQKASYKEEIFLFTTELFDIWSSISRLVREPSAETALETGAQLGELVQLTDNLKRVSTQLEFTTMELAVLVCKDFSQKNCKKDLATIAQKPIPSTAAQLRNDVAPTTSQATSSNQSLLSQQDRKCPNELPQNATFLPANSLETTDAEKSSFIRENQRKTQHDQCLPTKLNDRSADECSAPSLSGRDSCTGGFPPKLNDRSEDECLASSLEGRDSCTGGFPAKLNDRSEDECLVSSLEGGDSCTGDFPTKLNDRSEDVCSAPSLEGRDSCTGEPNDHVPPDAVSGCQFEEIRLSHVEADQASFIRASHYPDTDEDSPCADESTTGTISFIVIDPSDESCSEVLIDRPDHN